MIERILAALAGLVAATFAGSGVLQAPPALWQRERTTIVVFGYAGCGDVCPRTLRRLSTIVPALPVRPRPRVLFVDVDPRQTDEQIAAYLRAFPGVERFAGSAGAVRDAQRQLGIVPASDPVRHDARVFAVDAAGVVVGVLPPTLGDAALRARLERLTRPAL